MADTTSKTAAKSDIKGVAVNNAAQNTLLGGLPPSKTEPQIRKENEVKKAPGSIRG